MTRDGLASYERGDEDLERYEQGERLWREHFSCGHTQLIFTFVGDFDFFASRKSFPGFCMQCYPRFPGKRVELVSAEEVPVEEW